jgi:3'-5' exoribonuclease
MEIPQNVRSAIGGNPQASEKGIFIKDLKGNDIVRSTFLVQSKSMPMAKNGKPYLSLLLSDSTGVIDTRIWNDVETVSTLCQEGDVVAVSAKTHVFQNRMQMVVSHIVPVPPSEVDPLAYIPRTEIDLEAKYQELLGIFQGLENPWVRELGLALLNDPEIAARYKVCPAAKTIHHAFLGGLLVHSVQLIHLVDAILPHYENLDRSILIFGAAFHDFGKIYELSYSAGFGYTDEGKLVGHIAIGVQLVDRKILAMPGFPKDLEYQLKHIILSHHGRLEYGSPKRPQTLEAQLLHHLDDMDSKINSIQTLMETEANESRWTAHHKAYDNYYYKSDCYLPHPEGH